jgi:hypothetical protein
VTAVADDLAAGGRQWGGAGVGGEVVLAGEAADVADLAEEDGGLGMENGAPPASNSRGRDWLNVRRVPLCVKRRSSSASSGLRAPHLRVGKSGDERRHIYVNCELGDR